MCASDSFGCALRTVNDTVGMCLTHFGGVLVTIPECALSALCVSYLSNLNYYHIPNSHSAMA